MARPNVTVLIDDQSYVIPNSESGSLVRGGVYSFNGLVLALGNTAERQEGLMVVSTPNDWIAKLQTREAIGADPDNQNHYSHGGYGTTGAAWPYGPTGSCKMSGGQSTTTSNMVVFVLLVQPVLTQTNPSQLLLLTL